MIKFNKNEVSIVDSNNQDLYQYRVFVGKHHIHTSNRNSYWYIMDNSFVCSKTGDGSVITSEKMCVELYGYTPETRICSFTRGTDLPYVNGCSTKQLIPPVRPGDPTFQMLQIPSGSSEQAHHIHATPRVVYVADGHGVSVIGTPGNKTNIPLETGDVIILTKMESHHFETTDSNLTVLPVHIFSSIQSEEFNHPMFNGTHKV